MSWFGFFKPRLSSDFVELSVGKICFKEITNGIVNRVTTQSTIAKNVINNNLYFQLMEYELLNLSKREIDNLPLRDANKVREAVKKILLKNKLLVEDEPEEEKSNIFSKKEVEWFEKNNPVKNGRIKS